MKSSPVVLLNARDAERRHPHGRGATGYLVRDLVDFGVAVVLAIRWSCSTTGSEAVTSSAPRRSASRCWWCSPTGQRDQRGTRAWLSYGGSATVLDVAAVAFVLNIGRQARTVPATR